MHCNRVSKFLRSCTASSGRISFQKLREQNPLVGYNRAFSTTTIRNQSNTNANVRSAVDPNNNNNNNNEAEQQIPALPLPNAEDAASSSNTNATNTVKLDDLGPVVVNEDGTISQIKNWHEMNDWEKEALEKLLLTRNRQRLAKLRQQQQQQQQQQQEEEKQEQQQDPKEGQ